MTMIEEVIKSRYGKDKSQRKRKSEDLGAVEHVEDVDEAEAFASLSLSSSEEESSAEE